MKNSCDLISVLGQATIASAGDASYNGKSDIKTGNKTTGV